MKIKVVIPVVFSMLFLIHCSEKKVSYEEALHFYVTIVKASDRLSERHDDFENLLSSSVEVAKGRSPQKLDSLELVDLKTSFKKLNDVYDSNLVILNSLSEVDNQLGLKSNSIESLKENSSSMLKLIPLMLGLLSNGLETNADAYNKEMKSFHLSSEKVKNLNSEIEKSDVEFRRKYEIGDDDLKKLGLENY